MACDSSYWILESGSLDFSWGNPRGFESHSKQSASLFAAWEVVERRERSGMSNYTAVGEGHKRRKCDQAVDAWRHLPRWTSHYAQYRSTHDCSGHIIATD